MTNQSSNTNLPNLNDIYNEQWTGNYTYNIANKSWRYKLLPRELSKLKRAYSLNGQELNFWYTVLESNKQDISSKLCSDKNKLTIKRTNDEIALYNDWLHALSKLNEIITNAQWIGSKVGVGFFEIVAEAEILKYIDDIINRERLFKRLHRYNDESIHGVIHSELVYNINDDETNANSTNTNHKSTTNGVSVPIVSVTNSSNNNSLVDGVVSGVIGGATYDVVSDMLSD